ncbi:hypothetical protein Ahy_B08g091707 [Arachis hypogaea]|uniref:Zinc finger PMZ-type domain-containing protein n=1 Tax=Arachis hypogaea TaxID=3818 RepID=A0A444Y2K0_ARAHY|nr:hypothetical protein Ahy_B08g091707 [Arachis hypogaea]
MQKAIEACMPTTIHHWCIWHIMKKIPSKLNGYKEHLEIEQKMSHVVWNSHTKESFDRNWNDFLMKYGLVDNKWLSCVHSPEVQGSPSIIQRKVNCITRSTNFALGSSVYEVVEQVSNSTFNKFAVTYDLVAAQVKYQCLLFESKGILCRHALNVLSFERVNKVPPRYILERWSMNVKRRHTHIKSSHNELVFEPRCKRFEELELTAILHRAYDNIVVEMQELKAKRKGSCSLSHEDANLEPVNELQCPPSVRTRGRPKNKLGSKLDRQIANVSKKKKTKALSELNLFYGASVVQPNFIQYHRHVINYQFRDPAAGDRFLGV